MARSARFACAFAAAALLQLHAAPPAASQVVQSRVRAHSIDDHEPIYHEDCDPSPSEDPEEDGCRCDGVDYGPDEVCVSDWLFTVSEIPGQRIQAESFTCFLDVCAGPTVPEDGIGVAETDFGSNFVDVFAHTVTEDPYVYDSGGAASIWFDELAVSSPSPLPPGATIRVDLRLRGSWQNGVCFAVITNLVRSDVEPANPRYQLRFNSTPFPNDPLCVVSSPTPIPDGFEDYGQEDGAVDLVLPLEIPLVAPSKVGLFSQLSAFGAGTDARLDGPRGGLELTVENIDVPPGVSLVSETGTVYPVPEPRGTAATAAIALVGLAALRGAARRQRPETMEPTTGFEPVTC